MGERVLERNSVAGGSTRNRRSCPSDLSGQETARKGRGNAFPAYKRGEKSREFKWRRPKKKHAFGRLAGFRAGQPLTSKNDRHSHQYFNSGEFLRKIIRGNKSKRKMRFTTLGPGSWKTIGEAQRAPRHNRYRFSPRASPACAEARASCACFSCGASEIPKRRWIYAAGWIHGRKRVSSQRHEKKRNLARAPTKKPHDGREEYRRRPRAAVSGPRTSVIALRTCACFETLQKTCGTFLQNTISGHQEVAAISTCNTI